MKCYEINYIEKNKSYEFATFFGISYCMTNEECEDLHKKHYFIRMINMWDYGNFLIESYEINNNK